jgi:hypothetical protein
MTCALLTNLLRYPIASAVEPAPFRDIDGVEHISLDGLKISLLFDVLRVRNGGEERRCVGML